MSNSVAAFNESDDVPLFRQSNNKFVFLLTQQAIKMPESSGISFITFHSSSMR